MAQSYEDLVDTQWPRPSSRRRMPLQERAAQFAPFSALTGFDEVIDETARITQTPVFLSEESLMGINRSLDRLKERLPIPTAVEMLIYCPDKKKEGGSFRHMESTVKKLDSYAQTLTLEDGSKIYFRQICELKLADCACDNEPASTQ